MNTRGSAQNYIMKFRYVIILCLLCAFLCFSAYAKSPFDFSGTLSSLFDLRFAALLFFFACIAVLPTFHIWGGGQNGS